MAEAVTKLVDAVCCIIHDGSPLRAEDQSGFYTGYLFTVLKVSILTWLCLGLAALSSTATPCVSTPNDGVWWLHPQAVSSTNPGCDIQCLPSRECRAGHPGLYCAHKTGQLQNFAPASEVPYRRVQVPCAATMWPSRGTPPPWPALCSAGLHRGGAPPSAPPSAVSVLQEVSESHALCWHHLAQASAVCSAGGRRTAPVPAGPGPAESAERGDMTAADRFC